MPGRLPTRNRPPRVLATTSQTTRDPGTIGKRAMARTRLTGQRATFRTASFARGWVRAKLLLQEELPDDESAEDDEASDGEASRMLRAGDGGGRNGSAPVPVENGLVITRYGEG